jgi:hypothetical protein
MADHYEKFWDRKLATRPDAGFGHARRVVGRGSAVDEARANFISQGCKLPSLIRLERTVASMQPGEEMQRERVSIAGIRDELKTARRPEK